MSLWDTLTSHPRLQSTLGSTQDAVEGQNVRRDLSGVDSYQTCAVCCSFILWDSEIEPAASPDECLGRQREC